MPMNGRRVGGGQRFIKKRDTQFKKNKKTKNVSTIVSHSSFPFLSFTLRPSATLQSNALPPFGPAHARLLCLLHHPKVPSPIHSNSRLAIYFKISFFFLFHASYPLHPPKEEVWGEMNPNPLAALHQDQ